jgi:hypothetical protein
VALPALEQKCRALIEQMRAAGDHLADSEQALVRFYSESTEQWADELDAALAQADGPAPKE